MSGDIFASSGLRQRTLNRMTIIRMLLNDRYLRPGEIQRDDRACLKNIIELAENIARDGRALLETTPEIKPAPRPKLVYTAPLRSVQTILALKAEHAP
jgi:hypothetical protein